MRIRTLSLRPFNLGYLRVPDDFWGFYDHYLLLGPLEVHWTSRYEWWRSGATALRRFRWPR